MITNVSARLRPASAAFALGLGAAFALAVPALADPKVLAKVDGAPITDEDVADAMADIGPGLPQKLEGEARQKYVLDYLIDLKLAAKKADDDKSDGLPRVRPQARLLPRQARDGTAACLRGQVGDDRGRGAQGLR